MRGRLRELVRAAVGVPRAAREVRTVGGGPAEVARVADGWSPRRCARGRVYRVGAGHGAVSRELYDAVGPAMVREMFGGAGLDRITVVEPDGTLTDVDGVSSDSGAE